MTRAANRPVNPFPNATLVGGKIVDSRRVCRAKATAITSSSFRHFATARLAINLLLHNPVFREKRMHLHKLRQVIYTLVISTGLAGIRAAEPAQRGAHGAGGREETRRARCWLR